MNLERAKHTGIRPLIGLYSESGCGKTFSSLLLARGFAGPTGRIAMIDTESGRGSLYADVIPGGYDVLPLSAPFSPERYIEAIETVEKSDAAILVVDSVSHEWEGIGGVLDMAGQVEKAKGKSLNVWREPKLEHARMMVKFLQCSLPVIVCMRAKFKTRQFKDKNGKTEIAKDDHTTPIQADDFIFEMTAHAEIFMDHSIKLTKHSHPALRDCFPTSGPITQRHGELLAAWCNAPVGQPTKAEPEPPKSQLNIAELKKELWDLTAEFHLNSRKKLNQFLWDEGHIDTTEQVEGLSAERIALVIKKVKKKREPQKV